MMTEEELSTWSEEKAEEAWDDLRDRQQLEDDADYIDTGSELGCE